MSGPTERATLAEVAARAGVSETTASNALSGRRHVAPATKARIAQIAREIGYRPNQVARSLRARSTRTIAFVVSDISNVSLTTSIRAASSLLRERSYAIEMVDSPENGPTVEVVQQVLDRVPDGVIFFGEEPSHRVIDLLSSHGVSFVAGGLGAPHDSVGDIVYTDQSDIVREVTAGLARSVEGRICFIGGNTADEGARARLRGFQTAMASLGREIPESDIAVAPYSIDGGMKAMSAWTADPPALLVAGSDQIAQGAMVVAREAGITIPDRMQVVGFDNIESCRVTSPTLSSIDVGLEHQGILCAQMLLDRVENTYAGAPRRIRFDASFVPRNSTRP